MAVQIYTYPLIFRLIYTFGNLIVTIFLILYSIPLIFYLDKNYILIIPVVISLLIIYYINRKYFILYKILPHRIEADDEKLICSGFLLSKKKVIIHYEDIETLSGGIFDNKISGVMKVCDGKNAVCIGFYQKLRNSNKLATLILSKVRRELYNEILEKLVAKRHKSK